MDENTITIAEYIAQTAVILNLPIPLEYRPNVVDNFAKISAIAKLVNEFPLPPEIEAAPVFKP